MKRWELNPFVYKGLIKVEQKLKKEARSRNEIIRSILLRLVDAGGKRLRPALVLLCGGYGGVDMGRLVPLAASVEMIHMATLMHDDIIDDADYRRGVETTHKKWDTHTAIFAGDYLLSKAFGLITEKAAFDESALMAKAFKLICEGEIEQYYTRNLINTSVRRYLARIRYKTAMLFSMSCHLGASLSDLSVEEKRILKNYGMHLGMVFQIQDDLLDILAGDRQLGKPAANDVRQGIYTLPVIYTLNSKKYGRDMKKLLQESNRLEEMLDDIVIMVRDSGSIEKSRALQQKYVKKAKYAIQGLTRNAYSEALEELLLFTADREK